MPARVDTSSRSYGTCLRSPRGRLGRHTKDLDEVGHEHGAISRRSCFVAQILIAARPGLVAMLANTDAGSIITVAQSSAKWGYQLLMPNLLLIPFMYVAQQLASRLRLGTGRGAAELVSRRLGCGPPLSP